MASLAGSNRAPRRITNDLVGLIHCGVRILCTMSALETQSEAAKLFMRGDAYIPDAERLIRSFLDKYPTVDRYGQKPDALWHALGMVAIQVRGRWGLRSCLATLSPSRAAWAVCGGGAAREARAPHELEGGHLPHLHGRGSVSCGHSPCASVDPLPATPDPRSEWSAGEGAGQLPDCHRARLERRQGLVQSLARAGQPGCVRTRASARDGQCGKFVADGGVARQQSATCLRCTRCSG